MAKSEKQKNAKGKIKFSPGQIVWGICFIAAFLIFHGLFKEQSEKALGWWFKA